MANIVVTMTPDEQRLFAAQQKLIAQAAQLAGGYGNVGKQARAAGDQAGRAGKTQQRGFGAAAMQQLAGVAAGYASIGRAIAVVNQLLTEQANLKREAASAGQQASGGLSQLAQLATSQEQYQQLTGAARRTFREGATADLGAAADLVFALESAGALGERKLFSDLGSSGLVRDPAQLARATATIQTALGSQETGNLRAIISKGFAASAIAPATTEQLLEAAAGGGGSARALGMTDEELLTATAVLSKASGSAGEGGTQIEALLTALDKKGGFQGLSLTQALDKIQGMGLEGQDLQEFFGRKEGLKAYRALQLNRGLYSSTLASVETAAAEDLTGARLALPGSDPTVRNAQLKRKAQAALTLHNEEFGQSENLIEAVRAAQQSRRSSLAQAFDTVSYNTFGQLFNLGGEHGREIALLNRFVGQHGTAAFQPRNAEEAQLVLRVFERLDELGQKWDASAEALRRAAERQADHSHAARLEAAAAKYD